jgi:glycosyltransferase involved in cell wall biosynthesis
MTKSRQTDQIDAAPAATESEMRPDLPEPIKRAYLLVIHIPYYTDDSGAVWLERLWHRDFVRHLTYLRQLTLAASACRLEEAKDRDLVRVEIPPGVTLNFVPLGRDNSRESARRNLPGNIALLWRAVGQAEIVHSHIVGYPTSWIANCIALLRKKRLLIMVESAPWRTEVTGRNGWKARTTARAVDMIGRWFVNRASISFFTQATYRDSFLTRGGGPGFVTPASWIDEADVLDEQSATTIWREKLAPAGRIRLLYAGRLVPEKGVGILLDALAILRERGLAIDIDIIGEGDLRNACLTAAKSSREPRMRVLDPVPYGAPFFTLLGTYHAIVVPSLSDEQPRIVFDAYARGLPVIASDTDGLRPHVFAGRTGCLVARGNARLLADGIAEAAASPETLERHGLAALAYARTITHRHMHLERWRHLSAHLGS